MTVLEAVIRDAIESQPADIPAPDLARVIAAELSDAELVPEIRRVPALALVTFPHNKGH